MRINGLAVGSGKTQVLEIELGICIQLNIAFGLQAGRFTDGDFQLTTKDALRVLYDLSAR